MSANIEERASGCEMGQVGQFVEAADGCNGNVCI